MLIAQNWIEAGQAYNIPSRQKENRSRTAGEVGETAGGEQEGGLAFGEPAAE
jgi:hypothetical protein